MNIKLRKHASFLEIFRCTCVIFYHMEAIKYNNYAATPAQIFSIIMFTLSALLWFGYNLIAVCSFFIHWYFIFKPHFVFKFFLRAFIPYLWLSALPFSRRTIKISPEGTEILVSKLASGFMKGMLLETQHWRSSESLMSHPNFLLSPHSHCALKYVVNNTLEKKE